MRVETKRTLSWCASAVLLAFALGALAQRRWGWPFPPGPGTGLEVEGLISDAARKSRGRFVLPSAALNSKTYVRWDPVAGHVHLPNARVEWSWPEYERGVLTLRTNDLGFRRDTDTPVRAAPGTYRVLVAGDSHSDGFVDNDHTFCHLLEQRLAADRGGVPVEVLNGAVIASGPHNYVGQVERNLHLGIDLVVVVLYAGNDFLNAAVTAGVRGVMVIPERSPEYRAAIERAAPVRQVQQGVSQAKFFREFPQLRAPAQEEVQRQLRWLRRVAELAGFELVVAALPTCFEIEWPRWPEARRAAAADAIVRVLDLEPEDLAIHRELTDELLTWLRQKGFAVLDLAPALRAAEGKLYWDSDYHLAQDGHAVVAEAMHEFLKR